MQNILRRISENNEIVLKRERFVNEVVNGGGDRSYLMVLKQLLKKITDRS